MKVETAIKQIEREKWLFKNYEIRIDYLLPSREKMEVALRNLKSWGFSKEEIQSMINKLPALLSYKPERTNALLELYREYQIGVVRNPYKLAVNPKKIKERISFLEKYRIDFRSHPSVLLYPDGKFQEFLRQNNLEPKA